MVISTATRRKKTTADYLVDAGNDEDAVPFDAVKAKGSYKVIGQKLVAQQFWALFVKRFHHAR